MAAAALALLPAPLLAQTDAPPAPEKAVVAPVRDEAAIAAAWGYAASDLTPDPAVRLGVLPNGMRYAIRKNATPPGTAVMRLLIDVGSTAEAED